MSHDNFIKQCADLKHTFQDVVSLCELFLNQSLTDDEFIQETFSLLHIGKTKAELRFHTLLLKNYFYAFILANSDKIEDVLNSSSLEETFQRFLKNGDEEEIFSPTGHYFFTLKNQQRDALKAGLKQILNKEIPCPLSLFETSQNYSEESIIVKSSSEFLRLSLLLYIYHAFIIQKDDISIEFLFPLFFFYGKFKSLPTPFEQKTAPCFLENFFLKPTDSGIFFINKDLFLKKIPSSIHSKTYEAIGFIAILHTLKQLNAENLKLPTTFENFIKVQTAKVCHNLIPSLGNVFYAEQDATLSFCKDCYSTFIAFITAENHYFNQRSSDELLPCSVISYNNVTLEKAIVTEISNPKSPSFHWFNDFALLSEQQRSSLLHLIRELVSLFMALNYLPKELALLPRDEQVFYVENYPTFSIFTQTLCHFLSLNIDDLNSPAVAFLFDIDKPYISMFLNSLSPLSLTALKNNEVQLLKSYFFLTDCYKFSHFLSNAFPLTANAYSEKLSSLLNSQIHKTALESEYDIFILNPTVNNVKEAFLEHEQNQLIKSCLNLFPNKSLLTKNHFLKQYVVEEIEKLVKISFTYRPSTLNEPAYCFLSKLALRLFYDCTSSKTDRIKKEIGTIGLYYLLSNSYLCKMIFSQTKEYIKQINNGDFFIENEERLLMLLKEFVDFLVSFNKESFKQLNEVK